MPGSATNSLPPPTRLAAYWAASAARNRSAERRCSSSRQATPHENEYGPPAAAPRRCDASRASVRAASASVALHQHAELVAAEPAGERAGERLGGLGQRAAGRGERPVAGVVAVAVVDVLEPVEVAEQQRQLAPGRERAGHGLLQPLVERAPVRQPGERVLVGERLETGEQLGAADRRRDLRAEGLGEADVRRGERRRVDRRVCLQHTPHPVVDADRAGEHRAAADLLEERPLLAGEVGIVERDDVRRAALDELPVEPGQRPGLLDRPLLLAGDQLAGVGERAHAVVLGLPAADRDACGAQHLARLHADRVEHLFEPVRPRDGARHADQRAQLGLERPVGAHGRQLRLVGAAALHHRHAVAVEHAHQRGDGRRAEL